MKASVWNDSQWLWPDSPHSPLTSVALSLARGGHSGAQILGDGLVDADTTLDFHWDTPCGPAVRLWQLLPVTVNENTAADLMTTLDYESCRSFVTRQAPFSVYDALRPVEEGLKKGIRPAFYLCADDSGETLPGTYEGSLTLKDGKETVTLPVICRVWKASIPALSEASLGMLNFLIMTESSGITMSQNTATLTGNSSEAMCAPSLPCAALTSFFRPGRRCLQMGN